MTKIIIFLVIFFTKSSLQVGIVILVCSIGCSIGGVIAGASVFNFSVCLFLLLCLFEIFLNLSN